jgi:hypothetical protein
VINLTLFLKTVSRLQLLAKGKSRRQKLSQTDPQGLLAAKKKLWLKGSYLLSH